MKGLVRWLAAPRPSLHRLMFDLFFPAVLGAIIVKFIDLIGGWPLRTHPKIAIGLVFVLYWSFVFVYLTRDGSEVSVAKFAVYAMIIFSLYLAFFSLPSPTVESPDYSRFYLGVGLIGGAYLLESVFDLIGDRVLPERDEFDTGFLAIDIVVLALGVGFYLSVGRYDLQGSTSVVYVFLGLTVLIALAVVGRYWSDAR